MRRPWATRGHKPTALDSPSIPILNSVREVRFQMVCSVSMCLTPPSRERLCRKVGTGGKEEGEMEEKNSGQPDICNWWRELRRCSPPPMWSSFGGLQKQEAISKCCILGGKNSSPCDAAAVIISSLSPLVCCCFSEAVSAFSATPNPVIFLHLLIINFEISGKNESSSVNSSPPASQLVIRKSSHGNRYMP